MKRFTCGSCSNTVHFDNTVCLHCQSDLGFDPATMTICAFAGEPTGFRKCANHAEGACNWLVPDGSDSLYCFACSLDRIVPNLTEPEHAAQWRKVEAAKRHFLYGLMKLRLPIVTRKENPEHGLAFELLAELPQAPAPVMTGHENGLITINVAEASDPEREARRVSLGEPMRTLIGHFRHESGHYYWNLLFADEARREEARAIFGDERIDYQAALVRHYANGPPADWNEHFISAYASSHPWEDFAETWAHYLHLADGLETAFAYELLPAGADCAYEAGLNWSLAAMTDEWVRLTIGVNAINRSIGQPDLYSFIYSPEVTQKLAFMHDLVTRVCADPA